MHRLDMEKKELNSRFSILYSTLKRFVRVLDDGQHQQNVSAGNRSLDPGGPGIRFLQPLSTTLGTWGINVTVL